MYIYYSLHFINPKKKINLKFSQKMDDNNLFQHLFNDANPLPTQNTNPIPTPNTHPMSNPTFGFQHGFSPYPNPNYGFQQFQQSGYPPFPQQPGYPPFPQQPGYPPYPQQLGYPQFQQFQTLTPTPTPSDTQISLTSTPSPQVASASPVTNRKKEKQVVGSSKRVQKKWSPEEDKQLTKAMLHVSVDSIVGNNQKSNDYWARIEKYFCSDPKFSRTASTLRSHWHMISPPTQKFSNLYNRIKAQKSSGWSDDQIIALAREEYASTGSYFQYEHVWNLVKDEPKWHEPVPFRPKRTKTSASGDYSTSASDGHSIPIDLNDDTPISFEEFNLVDEPDEYQEPTRPMGQKKAKAKAKAKKKAEAEAGKMEELAEMMKKRTEVADTFKQQMDQFLFNQDINILMMDRSHMDPERLATHKAICEQIKKKHNL